LLHIYYIYYFTNQEMQEVPKPVKKIAKWSNADILKADER
jgi:hypothetical protein